MPVRRWLGRLVAWVAFAGFPSIAAWAGPGPQAYGPVRFGDLADAVHPKLDVLKDAAVKQGRMLDATDAMEHFLRNGPVFAPKLTARYSRLQLYPRHFSFAADGGGLIRIGLTGTSIPANAYETSAREAWEILVDLATSKLGKPLSEAPFPPADGVSADRSRPTLTHVWKAPGLNVSIEIVRLNLPGGQMFQVILWAEEK